MKKPTILIVGEEIGMRVLLHHVLEEANYSCKDADTHDLAVELSTDVDLIVMDLKIDGPDGKEILEEMRARKIWTPVLIVSSAIIPTDLYDRLKKLRIVALIQMPSNMDQLKHMLLEEVGDRLKVGSALQTIQTANADLDTCLMRMRGSGFHAKI